MEMKRMAAPGGFYTMKGYTLLAAGELTSAMEDYLEMIARLGHSGAAVRVGELSSSLHVKASSVTKMIQQLVKAGLVHAQRYGDIALTEKGASLGDYLLYRHDVLNRFLCLLNGSDDELEQVEKIEHFINEQTVKNLEQLSRQLPMKPHADD
jgi:DtxR family Mn-dependent transcriptional regulator